MKQKLSLFFIGFLLLSCSNVDVNEQLISFLEHKKLKIDDYNFIHIVTENGCPGCNQRYYQFVQTALGEESHLVVLAAQGTYIDISGMNGRDAGLVRVENQYLGEELFDSTRFFSIKEGEVNSVITFNADKINAQIASISLLINN